ncbi:hypothetical protein RUM44_013569 [Polyplax serrata]|uniref:BHLH domain-containing protein n=1 Tax=Polyplax serrata TaxID=468196 RepID=A0ABR1BEJ5_POLSC
MANLFGSSEDEDSFAPSTEHDGSLMSETSSEEDASNRRGYIGSDDLDLKVEQDNEDKGGHRRTYRKRKNDKPDGEAEQKTPRRRSTRNRSPTQVLRIKKHRRMKANDRERNRMHLLNEALDRLRCVLPTYPSDTKLTKIETLRFAHNYIWALSQTLQVINSDKVPGSPSSDFLGEITSENGGITVNVGNVVVNISDKGNMITSNTGSCAVAQQRKYTGVPAGKSDDDSYCQGSDYFSYYGASPTSSPASDYMSPYDRIHSSQSVNSDIYLDNNNCRKDSCRKSLDFSDFGNSLGSESDVNYTAWPEEYTGPNYYEPVPTQCGNHTYF